MSGPDDEARLRATLNSVFDRVSSLEAEAHRLQRVVEQTMARERKSRQAIEDLRANILAATRRRDELRARLRDATNFLYDRLRRVVVEPTTTKTDP